MSNDEYPNSVREAIKRYEAGEKPTYSTGICGSVTAGYGFLDFNGYFEFPLPVNQKTERVEYPIKDIQNTHFA